MKVTALFAVAALSYAPFALAANKAADPTEKVAQFFGREARCHFAAIGDPWLGKDAQCLPVEKEGSSNGFLKGRESLREFAACPVGGSDQGSRQTRMMAIEKTLWPSDRQL